MANIPRNYVGANAVACEDSDGTTYTGIDLSIAAEEIGTVLERAIRCPSGYRTPSTVKIAVVSSKSATDYHANIQWGASAGALTQGALVDLGYIGDTNVSYFVKVLTGIAAGGNRRAYLYRNWGGDLVALPAITAGPSVSGVTATGATITATFNASVASAKYIVRTANTTPTADEWAGTGASGDIVARAAFTSPQSVTGLTTATLYYVFVRVTDSVGFTATSAAINFTTGTASNLAPSFTSAPTDKAGTKTSYGFTLTWGATDADGDTITHWLSLDDGATWTDLTGTVTYNGGTGKYEVAVSDLLSSTAYACKIRLTDSTHTGANGTTSGAASVTTNAVANVTNLVATGGDQQVALTWDAATGASAYRVTWGTDGATYGNTIAPDPATNSYTHTGRSDGVTYYYQVCAVDAADNLSPTPAEANGTTKSWHTVFANTFDSDTIGGRPNGWVLEDGGSGAPDPWAVQAGGLNSTARALRTTYDQSHTVFAYHTFTSYAKVRATFRCKTGATIGSGKRHGTYYFHNGTNPSSPAPTNCAVVSLKDGYVQCYNNAWTNLVATSANTEYLIVAEFNAATDTYTVTVNGTLYDNSGNGWKYTPSTDVAGVNMFTASNGIVPAGEYAYVDEITFEYWA